MKNILLFLFFYFMSLFCFSVNENLVFEHSLDSNKKNTFISFFKISNDNKKRAVIECINNQQKLLLFDEFNTILFQQELKAGFNVDDIIFNSSSTQLLVKYSTYEDVDIHKFFIYNFLDKKIYKYKNYVFLVEFYGDNLIALIQDDNNLFRYTINLVVMNNNSLLEISEKGEFLADSFLKSIYSKENNEIYFIIKHENDLLKVKYSIESYSIIKTKLCDSLGDIDDIFFNENNFCFIDSLNNNYYINISLDNDIFYRKLYYKKIVDVFFVDNAVIILKNFCYECYFIRENDIQKNKKKFVTNEKLKQSSLSADKKFLALLFDDNSCKISYINDEKFSPVIKSHEEIKKIYFDDYNNNLIVIFDKKIKVYNFMPEDVNSIGKKRKFESEPEENSKKSKLQ